MFVNELSSDFKDLQASVLVGVVMTPHGACFMAHVRPERVNVSVTV
jgi:hypothetical protein